MRWRNLWIRIFRGQKPFGNFLALIQLSFMLGMSYILFPVALILKTMGYRFINIDLSQIGSPVYLDLLIREDKLTIKTPRHKMLTLASKYYDGNGYLNDLYKDHITLVRNPLVKFLLSPFFVSDVFHDNSFRYDFVVHRHAIAHDLWERYLQSTGGKHLISMPQQDVERVRDILKKHIPIDKPFVSLHVRDSGFYNDPERVTRNADIYTYKSAIKYLIEKGYVVIRMGNSTATHIDDMLEECGPMLFDYAHAGIDDEMVDCYFLEHCAFFIGLSSGPSSVPMLFGVNSCNINWYNGSNATNFIPGDISSFKKFRYKKDGSLVPFDLLMRPPYSLNPRINTLEEEGVYIENNDEHEVLATVKEFVETPRSHTTERQKKAKTYILPSNYGYHAKGNFSNVILRQYPEFAEFKDD